MLLLLCFLYFPMVASEIHMALFWGIPISNETELCQNFTGSWNQCYQRCYDNQGCLLSFLNRSICYTCGVNITNSFKFSNSSNGLQVALKYDLTTCPASIKTLSGTVIRANVTIGTSIYNIIATTDGNSLEISYKDIRCPDGWKYFPRITCGWCIKVFQSNPIIHDAAAAQCASEGAILTGMANTNERDYIQTTAESFIATSYPYQFVWIDGVRKTSCNTLATRGNCLETYQDAFAFEDKCASSLGGYIGTPDGANVDGVPQGCLALDLLPSALAGLADDQSCLATGLPLGYACGQLSVY